MEKALKNNHNETLENSFLMDNSKKKSYAVVIKEEAQEDPNSMISLNYDDEVMIATDNVQDEASQLDVEMQKDEESLEFSLSTELKAKLAAPFKQSIIIKLVRKSLGYKNFLLRFICIWRPTSNIHLINTGYGFYIVKFSAVQDFNHALEDGPWFVARGPISPSYRQGGPKAHNLFIQYF